MSNIYDGGLLRKKLTALSRQLMSQKYFIKDIWLGSKYASGEGIRKTLKS